MARYYTLLERDSHGQPWGVAFGDYDRETVAQEMRDQRDYGTPHNCLKIITTTDQQADIDAAIDAAIVELNAKG